MVWDLIRDAPAGQIIRYITNNKFLKYPEEEGDFRALQAYVQPTTRTSDDHSPTGASYTPTVYTPASPKDVQGPTTGDLEILETLLDQTQTSDEEVDEESTEPRGFSAVLSESKSYKDLETHFLAATAMSRNGQSRQIIPQRRPDGSLKVEWYTTDDPENPLNWSKGKKFVVALLMCLYTLIVYMAAPIFTPSETGVMKEFGVVNQIATLGVSMTVLGYGVGPVFWSPLSEIPSIGRSIPYIITFSVFAILIIPTALVQNMAGLAILRFLLGFFGSPCMATGGASMGDMYTFNKLPYATLGWSVASMVGPALGPIISGFSVPEHNWRWSQWELLWLSGPVCILMFIFMPETNEKTILLNRAKRLRRLLSRDELLSDAEVDGPLISISRMIAQNIWRPIQLMIFDPAIGFIAIYTTLLYGIYYSFFVSFSLVYGDMYHFNLGQQGLAFLSLVVGTSLGVIAYWSWIHFYVEPRMLRNGLGTPEAQLIPGLLASFLCPAGLFIFAWTARPDIHWIVTEVGITLFCIGVFIVTQCVYLYLPLTYPAYTASLFAGITDVRMAVAAATFHFSSPVFEKLGVNIGITLLAAGSGACCAGLFGLWWWGQTLRMQSKFSAK